MTGLLPSRPVEDELARTGLRLGIVGIGVSLLTYALAMVAPQLPPLLVGVVVILALACFVPIVPMLRQSGSAPENPLDTDELRIKLPLRLLADDCRQLSRSLSTFRDERRQLRPRRGFLRRDASVRVQSWQQTTLERFEREFRSWAIQVFDEVVEVGLMSVSARRLVTHPSATQVEHLPELFEDAARRLDQAAR